jgi:acetylcholinesterase
VVWSNPSTDDVADDFGSGIPFVEPPLGQLRLKPPVPVKELPAGNFDASNFGLMCLQPVRYFFLLVASLIIWFSLQNISSALMSEDCLTINIFRPSGLQPGANLPVVRFSSHLNTIFRLNFGLKVVLDVS